MSISIEIPDRFIGHLGPSVATDMQLIHVKLLDGRIIRNLAVSGGSQIDGQWKWGTPRPAEIDFDFTTQDIVAVKAAALLSCLFPWDYGQGKGK